MQINIPARAVWRGFTCIPPKRGRARCLMTSGSKGDILAPIAHFRFTPESRNRMGERREARKPSLSPGNRSPRTTHAGPDGVCFYNTEALVRQTLRQIRLRRLRKRTWEARLVMSQPTTPQWNWFTVRKLLDNPIGLA